MEVGNKVVGTIIRITLGKNKRKYYTIEFEEFGNATAVEKDKDDEIIMAG